ARCQEALGQTGQADEHYRAALKARPDDFLVLQQAAAFYLRAGNFAGAEPCLRKLCDPDVEAPPERAAWARRRLAVGLAAGGEERFREALALVAASAGETVGDRRARAQVLAARAEHHGEALRLLEATLPQVPLAPPDRLVLARLYESAGDVPRAREQMLALLAEALDPQYLAHYVRCLRRWGDEEEA